MAKREKATFGKILMCRRGWSTQEEQARFLNIPLEDYIAYENDEREPNFATLKSISQSLEITIDLLLDNRLINVVERNIRLQKAADYASNLIEMAVGKYDLEKKDICKVAQMALDILKRKEAD